MSKVTKISADVIIIGSGPSGISTASNLKGLGINPLVLERGDDIAWRWKTRSKVGQLLSAPSKLSLQKLRRFSKRPQPLTVDNWHGILKEICVQQNIKVHCGEGVHSISFHNSVWEVQTHFNTYYTICLVVCTGAHVKEKETFHSDGSIPVFKALDFEKGSRRWSNALVVGSGTSGCDITRQICEQTGTSAISVRSVPVVLPPRILGISAINMSGIAQHFPDAFIDVAGSLIQWLAFRKIPWRIQAKKHRLSERRTSKYAPTVDSGFVKFLRSGCIAVFPEILMIRDGQVFFADGQRQEFDFVVDATGYESDLLTLFSEADISDDNRLPLNSMIFDASAQGLFFVGLRPNIAAFSHSMPKESKAIAEKIKSYISKTNRNTTYSRMYVDVGS